MNALHRRRVVSALGYGAALVVLLVVFAAYLQPDFLVTLANQVWACF